MKYVTSVNESQAQAARDDQSSPNLFMLLNVIWRGKWIIGAITFLFMLASGYYAYFMTTPLFRANAVVILEARQENIVDLESVVGNLGSDNTTINSEVEVLSSRGLMEQVVENLNLTKDPEFNASLRAPTMKAKLREAVRSLLKPEESTPSEQAAVVAQSDRERQTFDSTVSHLLSAVTVSNIPQSLVFRISVLSQGPTKSARIADAIVDQYIQNQLNEKFAATEQASAWLATRVSELQQDLEAAEAEVKTFSSGTELVSQDTLSALERQLKDLRARISSTEDSAAASRARLQAVQEASTPRAKAAAAADPQLTSLSLRVSDPESRQSFETRLTRVTLELQAEVQRYESQIAALARSRDDLSEQIDKQQSDLIRLQQLTREAEASRLLYEYFLTRLKETSAQQGVQQADSRILSNAVIPSAAAAPRKSLIIAMGTFLGFLMGTSLMLLHEASQNTFRTPRELETITGYTTLGQIPLLPARRRRDVVKYLREKPSSAAAEAVRNLRTSILLSNIDQPPQIIATTSSTPGEGKTTISLALAQNLAMMGRRVLVIEGDVRRRIFTQYLTKERSQGLISVLAREHTVAECVQHDEQIGADVLLAEQSNANAADLFSSESFGQLIQEVRESYDSVIIDTPPVLVVPDARIIAQHVDAVLFAVAWDQTSKEQVREALHMFESQSASNNVKGIVLNKISPRGMRKYGYGGNYGAYSSYGRRYYVE